LPASFELRFAQARWAALAEFAPRRFLRLESDPLLARACSSGLLVLTSEEAAFSEQALPELGAAVHSPGVAPDSARAQGLWRGSAPDFRGEPSEPAAVADSATAQLRVFAAFQPAPAEALPSSVCAKAQP
jgi:hypothetical protein